MKNFSFYAPTYFDFGKGAENHVGELVARFGGSKVLLHFGGGSAIRSGLLTGSRLPCVQKASALWSWAA